MHVRLHTIHESLILKAILLPVSARKLYFWILANTDAALQMGVKSQKIFTGIKLMVKRNVMFSFYDPQMRHH